MITWTIGATGLLGSALVRQHDASFDPGPIPWHDPAAAQGQLVAGVRAFARHVGDRPWHIQWAAGRATVSASASQTAPELVTLRTLVSAIGEHGPTGPGTFFLASSAGGMYAGSHPAPFDADSVARPISPYGHLKAQQEEAARGLANRCTVVIGRIANLYGPSQRLDKAQGLISLLVQAAATRQSLNVFVPMDTIRDYIFIDDAAEVITRACADVSHSRVRVEVIASGQPVTIGQVIRLVEVVTKRKVPVALGSHPSSARQVRDLRLIPSLRADHPTGLPSGIQRIFADTVRRLQARRIGA